MATIKKRGKSWQLNWSENGKQCRVSLGAISHQEAKQAKLHKEIELGKNDGQAPYFDYYAAEYLEWYAVHYPASFERTRQIIVDHLSPNFCQYQLNQINARSVKQYQLNRQSVAIGTYLKEFRCLKAMLNRAVEWEYIDSNPIRHVRPPKDTNSKPPHFYTAGELRSIYEIAAYRWQWQFMANTGLRLGEAMLFNTDIHVRGDFIHIVSSEGARTKSGKWREVPLFDGARQALKHLDGKLFDINPKSVSRAFKRDLRRLNLDGSLHSLRHTFISHLAMTGKFSMSELQAWAGHQSVVTTQRYQHLIPNYREIDSGALAI
jgi:integrase